MKNLFEKMFFSFLLCIGSNAFAQYTFIGAGAWSSASNWDINGIPPNPVFAGNIYINGSGPAILDIDQVVTNSIPFGSLMRILASGSLVINVGRKLTINGSHFENLGTLISHGKIVSSATNFDNLNSVTINDTLDCSVGGGVGNWGSFINNGTINVASNSSFYNALLFTNNGIVNNSSIYPSGSFSTPGTLHNYGILNNSGSFNNLEPGFPTTTAVLNNHSIINNTSGAIFSTGGALNNYATLNIHAGSELRNTGTLISFIGTTFTNSGILENSATLTINESILHISEGGTLNNNGILTVNASIPNLTTGYIENLGLLNNNTGSTLNIYEAGGISNLNPAGNMLNNGTINIVGGFYSAGILNSSGNLTNNNILNIDSTSSLVNIGVGVCINSASGVLNIVRGAYLNNGDAATFQNDGIINNNIKGQISNLTVAQFTNNGTLTIHGSMDNQNYFKNNGTVVNNGNLRNNILDSLENNGILNNNGTLDNEGVFVNNNSLINIGAFNNLSPLGELILNTTPAFFPGGTFNWNIGSGVTIGPNGTMTFIGPVTFQEGKRIKVATGGTLIVQ